MPEYVASGDLKLHGVLFFVEAENEDDARRKMLAGEFGHYETNTASAVDWKMNLKTIEENI